MIDVSCTKIRVSGAVRRAAVASVALALGAVLATPVAAQQTYRFRFASYIGKSAAQSQATEWWAQEIDRRTSGRVKVQFFYGGALLPATDILRGVADRRADLGYVANAYHPAELPLSSVVGVPFVTSNAEAQARTFTELYRRNEAFRQEWQKQGVHVLLFHPLSENIVGMREPVRDVAGLKGKRIRGLGYINQVLEIIGANPVAIAAPEVYEALQRRTIDGYSGYAFEVVTALKLHEVAPHTVGMGTGNYVFAATPISRVTWDSMPDDLKRTIDEVSGQYIDKFVEIMMRTEDDVCAAIRKSGGNVTVFPDAEVQRIKDQVGDRIHKLWVGDATKRGAAAGPFLDDYLATLKKYEAQSKYVSGVKRCAAGK
jgi:TRAP-type C4-dicarboxylate transport system substrate-binding protein